MVFEAEHAESFDCGHELLHERFTYMRYLRRSCAELEVCFASSRKDDQFERDALLNYLEISLQEKQDDDDIPLSPGKLTYDIQTAYLNDFDDS